MAPPTADYVPSGRFEGANEEIQSLDMKSECELDLFEVHPYEENLFVVVC